MIKAHSHGICRLSLVLFLLSYSFEAHAQYVIDLAKQSSTGTETTVSVEPGKEFSVEILNRLPYSTEYGLSIVTRVRAIPTLSAAILSMGAGQKPEGGSTPRAEVMCAPLNQAIDNAKNATDEQSLAAAIAVLKPLRDPIKCQALTQQADALLELTKKSVPNLRLLRGEELVVTVTRDAKKWVTILTTGDRGTWNVTYGFALPWFVLNKDSLYETRSVGGKNIITPVSAQNSIQVIPALFISWIPYADLLSDWSIGLGSALGFDKTKPVLALGVSITYNQNLNILVSALGEFMPVLRTGYHSGDSLGETLTADQLHEQIFKIAPAIGISFRFDSNPFKSQ